MIQFFEIYIYIYWGLTKLNYTFAILDLVALGARLIRLSNESILFLKVKLFMLGFMELGRGPQAKPSRGLGLILQSLDVIYNKTSLPTQNNNSSKFMAIYK